MVNTQYGPDGAHAHRNVATDVENDPGPAPALHHLAVVLTAQDTVKLTRLYSATALNVHVSQHTDGFTVRLLKPKLRNQISKYIFF